MTLSMEKVDIRAEFEDTIFMFGSRLSEEGITLKYVDNEQDIPEISCDPQRLQQVFLNILNNAVKHGGEGRRIDASIHYQDDCVAVCVRDYGPGTMVSKRYYLAQNIEENQIDGYSEHTATLWREFKFKKCGLRLQAEVINLTDAKYDIIKYYPMPGRSWRLTGTFHF